MNVYIGTGRLPSAYQEVEYIESSGTQWLDTGVTPTQNTKSQIKFMNLEATGEVIYGIYTGSDSIDYRLFNASGTMYFDFSSSRISGSTIAINTVYELEIGNYYVKNVGASGNIISGTSISSYTGGRTITLNNYNNSIYSKNRWYYVKIWNGDTQVRDLVPCYRKSDSVIGMYDIINDVFYTNSGSGVFTKGSNVYANELKNVYIGEYSGGGYTPTANTIAYYPLNSNANDYSWNGYDLTATGTVIYSSQGATVDGSYLSRGTTALLPTGTNNRTTSLWTYATTNSNQGTLLDYGTNSGGQSWWLSLDSNGDLGFTGYGSGYNSGKYNISRDTRYNIVAIYTSNTVYVYVNGVLVITYSKSLSTGNGFIYIGKDPDYDTYYRGKISEVIIENKAWSAQEIQDYYNLTKSNYGL